MVKLILRLFGPFQVLRGETPLEGFDSDKVRALLAYLAVQSDRPHRREKLAGLLWPEYPETAARTSLRRALANLRDVIHDRKASPPYLIITRQTIQFNTAGDHQLDLADFLRLVNGDPDQVEQALDRYRGEFLEGFSVPDSSPFEDWLIVTREALRLQALAALVQLARFHEDLRSYDRAATYARRAIEIEPYDESAHRLLMRALADSGDQALAVAQYETLKDLLNEDLEAEPSERTIRLTERIRSGVRPADRAKRGMLRGYELREQLGEGYFGAVYRAFQEAMGRDVAIKAILPRYADEPDFIRRFEAEARLVAQLEHPHIVPLYDYWREPGGAYLVMRWLRGGSLKSALAKGPWSEEAAVRLVEQVAAALAAAHRQSVIHRDVKPGNILLDETGNAYLSDFGIATLTGPLATLTEGPRIDPPRSASSMDYLAPEIAAGAAPAPAADVYSFGTSIFELLTGESPFPGLAGEALLEAHRTRPLPSVVDRRSDLPAGVDDVLQKATAKDPLNRYQEPQQLSEEFRAALTGLPLPVPVPFPPPEIANPYKGLRAFQEADAGDFYGRERLVARLVERLSGVSPDRPKGAAAEDRFLAVVGPSGSGKSSLVKAGLLPALRRGAVEGSEHWFISEMTPGDRPFEELEAAILRVAVNPPEQLRGQLTEERGLVRAIKRSLPPDEGTDLLLLIDQFEELFTLTEPEERRAFLDALHGAIADPGSRVRILITMRADFFDRPLVVPGFSELMRVRTEAVTPLSAEELAKTIEIPARQAGLRFEDGLVARLVADVHEQVGALPLLQYALTELFERRQGSVLNLAAYEAMGGVSGALGRRAEGLYGRLDQAEQEIARQVFLRLVTPGEGVEDTRRKMLRGELKTLESGARTPGDHPPAVNRVLELFGRHRLLTFDRDRESRAPTVEVAHEALLREWRRLADWLEAGRADVRIERALGNLAADWAAASRDPSFLLRGARLDQFTDWADETDLALTRAEQVFLEAGLAERRARQAEEAARQAHERSLEKRSLERLRIIVGVLIAAFLVSILLTMAVLNQNRIALENEAQAHSLALAASARLALNAGETDLALALALAAVQVDNPPAQAQQALAEIAYAPGTRSVLSRGDTPYIHSLSFSADGSRALSGAIDRSVILFDLQTGTPLQRYSGYRGTITRIEYLSNENLAVLGIFDGSVRMLDLQTGREVRRLVHSAPLILAALSPDGSTVMWTTRDGRLSLLDLESRTVIREYGAPAADNLPGAIAVVTFHQTGAQALTGHVDGRVLVWDLESGEVLRVLEGGTAAIEDLLLSPDASQVLAADANGEVLVWDFSTGEFLWRYEPASINDQVYRLALSPDGRTAVFGASDGGLRIWDLQSGDQVARLDGETAAGGQGGWITDLVIAPDGRSAVACRSDGEVILWDLETGEVVRRFGETDAPASASPALTADLNPDGTKVLAGFEDGWLILWDVETGSEIARSAGNGLNVERAAFLPDGQSVLVTTIDGGLSLWNVEGGTFERLFDNPPAGWMGLSVSGDGRLALTTVDDVFAETEADDLLVWDLESGQVMQRLSGGHALDVPVVALSPDGSLAVSGDEDGSVRLWDLDTGQIAAFLEPPNPDVNVIDLVFSPDSRHALVSFTGGTMFLWELATGEVRQDFSPGLNANSMAFSPDGRIVYAGAASGEILLWTLETGQQLDRFAGHTNPVTKVELTSDGLRAVSGALDGTIRVWSLGNGAAIGELNWPGFQIAASIGPDGTRAVTAAGSDLLYWDLDPGRLIRQIQGEGTPIFYNVFSPDGRWVLSSAGLPPLPDQTSLILWDLDTGRILRRLDDVGQFHRIAITPDGRYGVVAADREGIGDYPHLFLWDLISGEVVDHFDLRQPGIVFGALDISPDGERLLTGIAFHERGEFLVQEWDLESGELLKSLSGHEHTVIDAVYLPDGLHAVTVSWDRSLILWDLERGEIERRMSGRNPELFSVAVDRTGGYALTGAGDGSLILWDLEAGQALRDYPGHDDIATHIAFSPDGTIALTSGFDGVVRIWQVHRTLAELIDWVQANRYVRTLTCQERDFYQAVPLCPP